MMTMTGVEEENEFSQLIQELRDAAVKSIGIFEQGNLQQTEVLSALFSDILVLKLKVLEMATRIESLEKDREND